MAAIPGFSSPNFTGYILIATGSYIAPSSSIGALQAATIKNNLEWDYHFCNSQTRINMQPRFQSNVTNGIEIPYTSANKYLLITSFGPFRINLDKLGKPQPMYVAFIPVVQNTGATVTGTYKGVLRLQNARRGTTSVVEVGTHSVTSGIAYPRNQTPFYWQHLSTSYADAISGSFGLNSSVVKTDFFTNGIDQMATRVTKSLVTLDSTQDVALAFFDMYYKITNLNGTTADTIPVVMGLYAREVNII